MSWNPCFHMNFHDWEEEDVLSQLGKLSSFRITRGRDDSLVWTMDNCHSFTVKSYYRVLVKGGEVDFSWKTIWEAKVPLKVAFFGWSLAWEAVLTRDNLQRKGFQFASKCYMCKEEGETIDHLLSIAGWPMICCSSSSPCLVAVGQCRKR
uniref:Reverse transcriptase zinc-binding domain-containing protein n=1 Tax=Davidia involucrata TaxID=16924 RepID=A0A5B7BSY5_DAVIN